jgi:hypothetical protein
MARVLDSEGSRKLAYLRKQLKLIEAGKRPEEDKGYIQSVLKATEIEYGLRRLGQ